MRGWWVRYKFCIWRVDGVRARWTGAGRGPRGGELGVSAIFRRSYLSELPPKAPERTLAAASCDRRIRADRQSLRQTGRHTRQESSAGGN